jgi:hypothetical protein
MSYIQLSRKKLRENFLHMISIAFSFLASIIGDELSIDLMWIEGDAELHVIYTATRFSAITYLDTNGADYGQGVDGIWSALVDCWVATYSGYPRKLRTAVGSVFTLSRWLHCTNMAGIQVQVSGVESHNSLGLEEKMYDPLCRIFKNAKFYFPTAQPKMIPLWATKVLNDAMGENGLVPALLVFGIIPRFPILSNDVSEQEERMHVLAAAQAEQVFCRPDQCSRNSYVDDNSCLLVSSLSSLFFMMTSHREIYLYEC